MLRAPRPKFFFFFGMLELLLVLGWNVSFLCCFVICDCSETMFSLKGDDGIRYG